MTWMVSVALFAYLGYLLDDALGTLPLFVIAGALLGVIGGFIHFLANVAPEVLPFGKSGRAADPDSATDPGPTDPGPDDPGPDDAPLDAAGPPKVDPDSTSPPSR